MGFFAKIREGLRKTRDHVIKGMRRLLNSFTKIDEDLFEELEELLIMGDVGVHTAEKICDKLRDEVKARGTKNPEENHAVMPQTRTPSSSSFASRDMVSSSQNR